MFKYLVFACFLALAAAKPGALVSSPVVSTYAGGPLTTYAAAAAPIAYSDLHAGPLTYSTYGLVKPYPYIY